MTPARQRRLHETSEPRLRLPWPARAHEQPVYREAPDQQDSRILGSQVDASWLLVHVELRREILVGGRGVRVQLVLATLLVRRFARESTAPHRFGTHRHSGHGGGSWPNIHGPFRVGPFPAAEAGLECRRLVPVPRAWDAQALMMFPKRQSDLDPLTPQRMPDFGLLEPSPVAETGDGSSKGLARPGSGQHGAACAYRHHSADGDALSSQSLGLGVSAFLAGCDGTVSGLLWLWSAGSGASPCPPGPKKAARTGRWGHGECRDRAKEIWASFDQAPAVVPTRLVLVHVSAAAGFGSLERQPAQQARNLAGVSAPRRPSALLRSRPRGCLEISA